MEVIFHMQGNNDSEAVYKKEFNCDTDVDKFYDALHFFIKDYEV